MKKKTPNPIPKHRRHGKASGKVKTSGRGKYTKSSNWKQVK